MEHDNAHHDPPGKEGARWAGRDDCGPPEHPDLSWGRRSGVHPCQDPPGPAAHPRTDGPPGRRPRPPTARYPGWSRPGGSPSCRCPGSPAAIRSPPP